MVLGSFQEIQMVQSCFADGVAKEVKLYVALTVQMCFVRCVISSIQYLLMFYLSTNSANFFLHLLLLRIVLKGMWDLLS